MVQEDCGVAELALGYFCETSFATPKTVESGDEIGIIKRETDEY